MGITPLRSSVIALKPCMRDLDVNLGVGELGTDLSTAHLTQLVSNLDSLVQALSSRQSTHESTRKHVAGTVGVDNLVVGEFGHRVGFGVGVGELKVGGRVGGGG